MWPRRSRNLAPCRPIVGQVSGRAWTSSRHHGFLTLIAWRSAAVLPDVNVLIQGFLEDGTHHGECHRWLQRTVRGPAPFGMADSVISGFLRIVTDPRIFKLPTSMGHAMEYARWLRGQALAVAINPGPRHWELLEGFCQGTGIRGPLVADAWFAALAMEHGCEWVTLDRDFSRFPGLRVSAPGSRSL